MNIPAIKFWVAANWTIVSDTVKALGFVLTAILAWWKYGKEKQKDRDERSKASSEKLHQLFTSFYLNREFNELRITLDFDRDYREKLEPVLVKALSNNPDIVPTEDEKKLLINLDTALNYFEFILHLEWKGHLAKEDRNAIFKYWFDLINRAEREKLHEYIAKYDYEAIHGMLQKLKQRDVSNQKFS